MADISNLTGLLSSEPLNLAAYADTKTTAFDLPKKGRFTMRSPESFPATSFGATNAGYLSVQIDPTIVGPTNEGFNVRYIRLSAKTFDRRGVKVSQIGDYLRACGETVEVSGDPQALADAIERTAGRVYQADLDWRVYNKNTGFSMEGMEKFPKLPNGDHQSWIEDAADLDEEGKPRKLRANLFIRNYVAAA